MMRLPGILLVSVALLLAPATAAQAAVKPVIAMPAGAGLSETTAHLTAWVNPKGLLLTDCHFEWGPAEGDYSLGSAPCAPNPGLTNQATQTGADLSGLQAETTYHFRVRATNVLGEAESDDAQFTTPGPIVEPECPNQPTAGPSSRLPDCRVYEQVSPPLKNSADVVPHPLRTRAAVDGNALQFTSFVGFGDLAGGSLTNEYMAVRDPHSGSWATHGISPRQQPTAYADQLIGSFWPLYLGEFSADLSHGVYLPKSPLTDAPNVADVPNIYLRDDLLTPGPGSYRLLSDAVTPKSSYLKIRPQLVGASEDFSRIYFESELDLTADSAGLPEPSAECLEFGSCGLSDRSMPKLYEWVDGSLRLAGILPNDDPTVSQAGQGMEQTGYALGTVSRDGTRAIFTAPPPIFDGSQRSGTLYVRDDQGTPETADDATTQVNVSEKSGEPDSFQPATYWAASEDATRVFFTTAEQLTDDDVNHSVDLYRADLDAPSGERLIRISIDIEPSDNYNANGVSGHDVSGVLGASADGNYVYFTVHDGQLIAGGPTGPTGGPTGEERIFVWHGGALHEVGAVNGNEELQRLVVSPEGWNREAAKWSRVTPDGTHLAFVTRGSDELLSLYGQPSSDHGSCGPPGSGFPGVGCTEVYLYDSTAGGGAGQLRCVSCDPSGTPATAHDDFYAFVVKGFGVATGSSHLPHVLSDDGRFVFFNSAEQLVEEDTNGGVIDAYRYDSSTGQIALLSAGTGSEDSEFLDASTDGHDAFFATREQLSPTDTDASRDLYDVRVEGVPGLAPLLPAPCDPLPGLCQEQAGTAPPLPASGSASFSGAGDQSIHRKRKHRKHRHRRHAHTHREAKR